MVHSRGSEERYKVQEKGMSHRDAFRTYSNVSSGGSTSKETNWKSSTEEKDRLNQQQGT